MIARVLRLLASCLLLQAAPAMAQDTYRLDIPAQPLTRALQVFANQSGLSLVHYAKITQDKRAPAVKGSYTPDEALNRLLNRSGLTYAYVNSRTIEIRRITSHVGTDESAAAHIPAGVGQSAGELRLARVQTGETAQRTDSAGNGGEEEKGTPEILVKGRRTLNTDIRRTEDDPQPYVVFDSEDIQNSQASSLEEFFRTRLPMNAAAGSVNQNTGEGQTTSSINLRGLGQNETLVVVDGRRLPELTSSGFPLQPDLNGIPLAAIERIEVLPSTAGGIYGGSATGGVVNIVLRRDYRGLELNGRYANTFDTDTGAMRLDANAGFSLENGRTTVMISATHSQANNLTIGDRDFARRAIALQLNNNPGAVTGSIVPPLGSTPNINSYSFDANGQVPLTLDPIYGGTALGNITTYIPIGYAGPDSDNGAALVANAGQYNLNLPAGVNGGERGLLATPTMNSVALNLRREFGARVEAFLDVSSLGNKARSSGASVPDLALLYADQPENPFQQDIVVTFPTPGFIFPNRSESTTVRATAGLIARLPHDWTGEIDYGWNRSRFERETTIATVNNTAFDLLFGVPPAAGQPGLNPLQEGMAYPLDFTPFLLPTPNAFSGPYDTVLKDATLRLSGPLIDLPGGPLRLAALVSRRETDIKEAFYQYINTTNATANLEPLYNTSWYPRRSQDTDSYYLETRIPLISRNNASSLARELELQLSVRHDKYMTTGNPISSMAVASREGPFPSLTYTTGRFGSTDYTVAVRYAPLEDLTLRASFGTGFLPPSVTQVAPSITTYNFSLGLSDPMRGDTNSYVGESFTYVSGGSANLQPETSESVSVGMIFTPRVLPGLRLSVDYTQIDKNDEIQIPGAQYLLDNEANFPGRITRGANLPGDQPGWAGPITSFDATAVNIARSKLEAYDVQLDYMLQTGRFGHFHWYAIATWQPHYTNQLRPDLETVDRIGYTGGPLKLRGNAGLLWDLDAVTFGWNVQHYDSYYIYTATAGESSRQTAIFNQGSAVVPAQTYHDLHVNYRFDEAARFAGGLLANTELSFGIQNLLDTSPPILASTSSTSAGYSTYGDPRLRRYTISLRKSFH